MERYYTSEQMAGFAELRAETPPEDVEAVEREWTARRRRRTSRSSSGRGRRNLGQSTPR